MLPEPKFRALMDLREEYRSAMNKCEHLAQVAASEEDMAECSIHSTESERKREAFHALNRAFKILEA